jgi:hypothetical protein
MKLEFVKRPELIYRVGRKYRVTKPHGLFFSNEIFMITDKRNCPLDGKFVYCRNCQSKTRFSYKYEESSTRLYEKSICDFISEKIEPLEG